MKLIAGTVAAVFGDEFAVVAIIKQGGGAGVYLKHDVTAVPAVPAVGAPFCHIFLAVKRHGAVAAVPRFDIDFCMIN